MKLLKTLLLTLITTITFAQQGINYKALIKDAAGNAIVNGLIQVQFNILDGATNVYSETHSPTTDSNGIIIINIGEGTPISGVFETIDWSSINHFLNVQVDAGSGLVDTGTTEFKTVPYALHALSTSDGHWTKTDNTIYNTSDNIGIGTNSVDAKLEIFQNGTLSNPHILLHENANDYARINFKNNNNDNFWSISAYIASNSYRNDRLNFLNGDGGNVMTMTGDGEVGIGVGISPKVNLHVGNQKRVLFGTDTIGAGDKLLFLPDLHAFRVGTLSTGAASTYWNNQTYYDTTTNEELNYIGLFSFASGLNTRAQGYGATAMGRDTEASNSYAMATGFFTNADGQYSTAMGFNTDAMALGSTALGYSTDAEKNYSTAMGYFSEAKGIYSTAIGYNTEAQSYGCVAIGKYNLGIGNSESWIATDPIFEVGIGSSEDNRANAMTIRKDGRVGIGTSIPSTKLQILGGTDAALSNDTGYLVLGSEYGYNMVFDQNEIIARNNGTASTLFLQQDGGNVAVNGNVVHTSDRRLKKNISNLNYGLKDILRLNPVAYNWKDRPNQDYKSLGLIAQELKEVISEVVTTEEGMQKMLHVNYIELIPVLIKAMQEQQEIINKYEDKVLKESKKLGELLKRVEILEASNK